MRLDGREAHHALHVLRLKRGDEVTVLNGMGAIYSCKIASTSKVEVDLDVLELRKVPAQPWRITLFQAIPKGKMFEIIVEKATELGAFRIVPILSQRVVSTSENPDRKLERWKLTAIESIKQCGSPWLPKIEAPAKLQDAITSTETFDLSLVASLHPGAKHPRHWLDMLKPASAEAAQLAIWIGPEGDFTAEEVALLERNGARPITLGNLVLRAETAAIYCLSVLSYEMQRRNHGPEERLKTHLLCTSTRKRRPNCSG